MSQSTLLAIAGTNARITIGGGSGLTASKYSVKVKGIKLPTTNFESVPVGTGAYAESISGIQEADITFEGAYDANADPFANNLSPGIITDVVIYVSKTSGVNLAFPEVIVTESTVETDVNGLVTFKFAGSSVGSFVLP